MFKGENSCHVVDRTASVRTAEAASSLSGLMLGPGDPARVPAPFADRVMTDPYRPLKNAFGRFATGVAVAACANARGGYTAITVNSFASVSLEPPLVLWCLEMKASSFKDFIGAPAYSVSILNDRQQAMSERFARHSPEPLQPHEYELWLTGAPVLAERLAGFDCRVVDRHRSGDHVILVGEVVQFASSDGAALMYFASRYAKGPSTDGREGA